MTRDDSVSKICATALDASILSYPDGSGLRPDGRVLAADFVVLAIGLGLKQPDRAGGAQGGKLRASLQL